MPNRIEHQSGEKRNRLTYIEETAPRITSGHPYRKARFACDCGNEVVTLIASWRDGNTTSCGCYSRELASERMTIHGHAREGREHPQYMNWEAMRARVRPSYWVKHPGYAGVAIDPRWATFPGFLAEPPAGEWAPGRVVARTGDTGDYSPENTRWATKAENAREACELRWSRYREQKALEARNAS